MEQRLKMIVDLIKRRHSGENLDKIKQEAKIVLAHIRPEELKQAEVHLQAIGMKPRDLHELRQMQLGTLQDELNKFQTTLQPDHPLSIMIKEHDQILTTLMKLEQLNGEVQKAASLPASILAKLNTVADNLLAAEPHHAREEDALFPELTKRNIGGTVNAMQMEHTELRERKHALKELVERGTPVDLMAFKAQLDEIAQYIIYNLSDHIYKENHIIYPASMRLLKEPTLWHEIKQKCDEIGYCDFKPL